MTEAVYTFNGKDITMNVCLQIRAAVNIIQEQLNLSFEDAMLEFYRSETYKTLQQTENALWAESPEFITDMFFAEREGREFKAGIQNKKSAGEVHLPSLISGLRFIGVLSKYAGQIAGRLRDPYCPDAIKQRQNSPAGKPSADSPVLLPARPNTAV